MLFLRILKDIYPLIWCILQFVYYYIVVKNCVRKLCNYYSVNSEKLFFWDLGSNFFSSATSTSSILCNLDKMGLIFSANPSLANELSWRFRQREIKDYTIEAISVTAKESRKPQDYFVPECMFPLICQNFGFMNTNRLFFFNTFCVSRIRSIEALLWALFWLISHSWIGRHGWS